MVLSCGLLGLQFCRDVSLGCTLPEEDVVEVVYVVGGDARVPGLRVVCSNIVLASLRLELISTILLVVLRVEVRRDQVEHHFEIPSDCLPAALYVFGVHIASR